MYSKFSLLSSSNKTVEKYTLCQALGETPARWSMSSPFGTVPRTGHHLFSSDSWGNRVSAVSLSGMAVPGTTRYRIFGLL